MVKSVATEKQAWEALSKEEFDLVLLDLNIDGKRCWETLKRAVKHPGKPVAIVFSCEDTKGNADYALSHGAYTFLSKPFNFTRLKTTIDSALGAKKRNGQVLPDPPPKEGRSVGGAASEVSSRPEISAPPGMVGNVPEGASPSGTVLVVGRDRRDREPLVEFLLPNGFTVKEASSGPGAIEAIKQESVDIVLMEIDEVAPDALESCWFLREHRDEANGVPVLAVTGHREEAVVAALRAGADDFFGGPIEGKLLVEKVRAHVRLRKAYERRLEQGIVQGCRAAVEGSDSPVYFRIRLKEELERTLRYKKQLTLALLALTNLEEPVRPENPEKLRRAPPGDYSPADVPHTIRTAFRRTDFIAASGENEFSVLMPETRSDRIFMRISDLRERIQKVLSAAGEQKSGVAVKVGLASLPLCSPAISAVRYVRSPEEFYRMARLALFQARLNENSPVAIFDA
jgi:DNA-binding response OmpR family regulator